METLKINTSIGQIAVQMNRFEDQPPILFLHGVYYDHKLWQHQIQGIKNRTLITLDMPLHGGSKNMSKPNWTLDDCAEMLLEILEVLKIEKAIAIGHSWGSMTILRAAAKAPNKFQSIGLCNMPFEATSSKMKLLFKMQHLMLRFRDFYVKQVAKALYGKRTYAQNPYLLDILSTSMSALNRKEIIQTDQAVILQAENSELLIKNLKVPALALKGREDYVPESKHIQTQIVNGGHVSPIEVPDEVNAFVHRVIEIGETTVELESK